MTRLHCLLRLHRLLRLPAAIHPAAIRTAKLFAILFALMLTACDTVLQYPDEEVENPAPTPGKPGCKLYLNVVADTEFQMLGEYEYDFENPDNLVTTRGEAALAPGTVHQLRYVLKGYRLGPRTSAPQIADFTMIFTSPIKNEVIETLELELDPGAYRLVVWADYVDEGSEKDKYYDTSDFGEIILLNANGHPGSNSFRDAFYGETTVNVPSSITTDMYAEIEMVRPMAKYTFVSNDLKDFFDMERSRTGRADEPADAPSLAAQLSDYTVRVVYTQYMPCSFNAHDGKPADSRTGVEYHSMISILDDNNAQLAFDHVFTNGTDSSVAVAMEVLHKDGSVVARMPQFNVPLRRSHHTIITGKFLTTKSGGAIGISPDFDGEFNIFIQ